MPQFDLQEQVTRIDKAIAETAKYAAEQRKLEAEARNFDRNRWYVPLVAILGNGALAAIIGAAVARLIH